MEKWPNFFIVGAPKAGTTSLYNYLKPNQEIYMSPLKEPHYFTPDLAAKMRIKPIRDKNEYLFLFQGAKNEVAIGEGSTHYLQDPDAPTLIHQVVPQARIVMILRDPVERAFSDYLMYEYRNPSKARFHKIMKMNFDTSHSNIPIKGILDAGFYFDQVKRYLDTFGLEQVKILIYEEFIRHTEEKIEEVLKFLGVNQKIHDFKSDIHNSFVAPRLPFAYSILNNELINKIAQRLIPSTCRRYLREEILIKKVDKPKMVEEDRIYLQNLYRDDVQKLRNLLGRSLPWPNF
jgi:hypothetical protein